MKISTLKYPRWYSIVHFILTILIPIVLVMIEGFNAPPSKLGTVFKVTFIGISGLVITWFFIKKLIINKIETTLRTKQVALEHDYSIEVGNPDKIRYLWYRNEIKLALFQFISVALNGGLIVIILLGVSSALLTIKSAVLLITSLYLIAYTIKFMILIIRQKVEDDLDEDEIEVG